MKKINKPTPQDINIFNLVRAILSKYEFETLVKFYHVNKSLCPADRDNLLHDEFPELYDKLIKIGGNLNGSTKI